MCGPQRFLRPSQFGQVTDDGGPPNYGSFLVSDGGGRDQRREAAAVLSHAHRLQLSRFPAADLVQNFVKIMLPLGGPQHGDVLPNNLLSLIAEDALAATVPGGYDALERNAGDG